MKFKAPANASSFGYGGKEHEIDEDGFIELPADAAGDAISHGFKPHEPVTDEHLAAIKRQERERAALLRPLKEKKPAKVLAAIEDADPTYNLEGLKALRAAEAAGDDPRDAVLDGIDEMIAKLEDGDNK